MVLSGILASGDLVGGIVAGVIVLAIIVSFSLRSLMTVVTEYQRAVFFRFGRIRAQAKGPGLIFRIPGVDRVVKVNLRVEVVDIPPQSAITADNVTLQVDAVVYFRVIDPVKAIVGVDNFRLASQRIAMTSLRSIIGRHELDNLLAHRDDINNELKAQIALSTQGFGVEVHEVQIRDITLPGRAHASDGTAGRSRTRAPCQGDRRHRRAGGVPRVVGGGDDARVSSRFDAAAVPADPRRSRDGAQLDVDLPDPD